MTAEQYVKSIKPTATIEKHRSGMIKGMMKTYYLVRERGAYMYIASGYTKSEAWRKAKEHLTNTK